MANKICPVCGKEIVHPTSNGQKYCSEECRRLVHNRRQKDHIVAHNDGISQIRFKIFAAYQSKCAICGWRACEGLRVNRKNQMMYSRGNEMHHIVPVKDGGSATEENLILLCPNHHKQADAGIITQEELKKYRKSFSDVKEHLSETLVWIRLAFENYQDCKHERCEKEMADASFALMILGKTGFIRGINVYGQYIDANEFIRVNEKFAKGEDPWE